MVVDFTSTMHVSFSDHETSPPTFFFPQYQAGKLPPHAWPIFVLLLLKDRSKRRHHRDVTVRTEDASGGARAELGSADPAALTTTGYEGKNTRKISRCTFSRTGRVRIRGR